jgi:hypothetical protein
MEKKKKNKPKISVIILNWNGKEMLLNCLDSVLKQKVKPFETIVIDNGSTDGSVKSIQNQKYKGIKIISLKKNIGFASANNIGMDKAKGDYLFILNNDTELEADCIERIQNAIVLEKDKKVGMYSTRMLNMYSKKIDNMGLYVDSWGLSWEIKSRDELHKLQGPCGGAVVYSREMLSSTKEDNGYYDSRFFIYFEDADLALRGNKKGWRCKYINTTIHHLHGATTKRMKKPFLYLFFRNRVLSYYKNWSSNYLSAVVFAGIHALILMKYTLQGEFNVVWPALMDGFQQKIIAPDEIFKRYS